MMSLSYILRKCTASKKFTKWHEKINNLIFMDNAKIFAKNENKKTNKLEALIPTIRIFN